MKDESSNKNLIYLDDAQERFNEISIDAIARLEAVENYFSEARLTSEFEAILSHVINFNKLLTRTAQKIKENLNNFLIDNGVTDEIIREFF